MYLLDSNFVINFLKGNPKAVKFMDKICKEKGSVAISSVTRFEVLIGAKKSDIALDDMKDYLSVFNCLNIDKVIVDEAVEFSTKKKLKFKDLLIAATAKCHKMILVTFDKDFVGAAGLKVKFFS